MLVDLTYAVDTARSLGPAYDLVSLDEEDIPAAVESSRAVLVRGTPLAEL